MTWLILLLKYWSRIFDRDEVPLEYPVADICRRLRNLRRKYDFYEIREMRKVGIYDELTNSCLGSWERAKGRFEL